MTVNEAGSKVANCCWFVNNDIRCAYFNEDALRPVKKEKQ